MPGGFVALCVNSNNAASRHQTIVEAVKNEKSTIHANFFKIKCPPPFDTVKGKLFVYFNTYRISHGGIKICLSGRVKIKNQNSDDSYFNIFRYCPIESQLMCDDLVGGHQRLNFIVNIPPNGTYPTPFMTSNGSLSYRLFALIKRYDKWEFIANKLFDFKGYYNISGIPLIPSVDTQFLQGGDIKSIFTVANPMVVMGCGESLKATLLLQGLIIENHVHATLTFIKIIKYGSKVHTDTIWSRDQLMETPQNKNILFEWKLVIPLMSRTSYFNELFPLYSVRYYLKYEATLGQPNVGKENMSVKGTVEVKVGTTRELRDSNTAHGSNQTTVPVIVPASVPALVPALVPASICRRTSVLSMLSLLSLPPAYSQLASRSASLMSLETMPPDYNDL